MKKAKTIDDDGAAAPALHPRDRIAGIERGLAILELFDRERPALTVTEVARHADMTRSAARRHLLTLASLGYLASDGKRFSLTPRVLKIGWSYFDSSPLPALLRPYLQRVTAVTGEAVLASVLDGSDVVFIARNGSNRVLSSGFALGARAPAQLAVAGILLMAFEPAEKLDAWLDALVLVPFNPHTLIDKALLRGEIEAARRQGYALLEQQQQVGVRGIAVPLRDRRGRLVAALSISMPMGGETARQALARVLPVLQENANALIAAL